ncbi:MAG: methyltransferase domain-containing protein, partial [Arenicellales bacterium]
MSDSKPVTEEFLDSEQYTERSIRAYEEVYGRDFVSPGGERMARELIGRLGLEPGSRVLDAGCGLGGSAFLMAREYGARVDAMDLSQNMIDMARRRCEEHGLDGRVALEHGDCLALDRPERYDAIYSRDVFLHIHDKPRLFKVLLAALRPGGRLLFTDYCCGEKPWSDEFSRYVEDRAYSLHTLPEYEGLLRTAGFVDVASHD